MLIITNSTKLVITISTIVYSLIFSLFKKYEKAYYKLAIRGVSTIHSILVCSIIGLYWSDLVSLKSMVNSMFMVSFGYFFADTYYEKKNYIYVVHHIMSLIGLFYIEDSPYIMSLSFFSEITTPFLNFSWFCLKGSKREVNRYLFALNSIVLLTLFFIFRICMFGYIISYIYSHDDVFESVYLMFIVRLFAVVVLVMNCVWFTKLLTIALSLVLKKNIGKSKCQ